MLNLKYECTFICNYGADIAQVSIVTRLRDGRPRFDSWQRQRFPSLSRNVQTGSEATQFLIQWLPGREAVHLSPSSAEIKNTWSYTSIPPIRLHGVVLS